MWLDFADNNSISRGRTPTEYVSLTLFRTLISARMFHKYEDEKDFVVGGERMISLAWQMESDSNRVCCRLVSPEIAYKTPALPKN